MSVISLTQALEKHQVESAIPLLHWTAKAEMLEQVVEEVKKIRDSNEEIFSNATEEELKLLAIELFSGEFSTREVVPGFEVKTWWYCIAWGKMKLWCAFNPREGAVVYCISPSSFSGYHF